MAIINWRQDVLIYRMAHADEEKIRFKRIGLRRGTPLERTMMNGADRVEWRDNLLAELHWGNGGLTLFDLCDPTRPRKAWHYTAPREFFRDMAFLPDGRILLAGFSLHILEPPQGGIE